MPENSKQKKIDTREIKVEISKEVAEGLYSNLVIINHSNSEFILDFTKILPGVSSAQVKARVIMTPNHAKSLLNALEDNIRKYEDVFGSIPVRKPFSGKNGFLGNSNVRFN